MVAPPGWPLRSTFTFSDRAAIGGVAAVVVWHYLPNGTKAEIVDWIVGVWATAKRTAAAAVGKVKDSAVWAWGV